MRLRSFLGGALCLLTSLGLACQSPETSSDNSSSGNPLAMQQDTLPHSTYHVPTRALTQGPGHHWFGYYDKLQFDPSGRYVLGMRVDFEHRSPRPDDVIEIGMVDTRDGDQWITLGESRAWGWQQGCMLQFIPQSDSNIIWNDRQGDRFVSHVLNIYTREKRTLPFPIYTLSPNGKQALSVDFERINDLRRGYGYAGIPDPNKEEIAPDDAGIYLCDLESGARELIISLGDMMALDLPSDLDPSLVQDYQKQKHWFNHLLFSPDGQRFIFLHRWKSSGKSEVGGFGTFMYTANIQGEDLRLLDPSGFTSHFIWRDPEHILAWTKHASHGSAFYLFEDEAMDEPEGVGIGIMTHNGHCTYLPGNEYILNDTYPVGEARQQRVYLYHIASQERIPLGEFYSPPAYKGEWRTDTHPRYSPDGKQVVIDCPSDSLGRQLYLLDISAIVAGPEGT